VARIKDIRFREVVRPLRTTFSTSLGQKQRLHNVIVQVVLEDGKSGIGEVPTSFAYLHETVDVIRQVLFRARTKLRGVVIEEYVPWVDSFRTLFPLAMMTVSGLEVALFRASLQEEGVSEYARWGRAGTRLETDITIPFLIDEGLLVRWIASAIGRGFVTYKLKVSGDIARDRAVLSLVYRALTAKVPGFRLRLDGNQGYTAGAYLDFLKHLEKMHYDIELFEQPLRKDDFRGFEDIRGRGHIPIVLDETVLGIDDAKRAIDNRLGDGINVKLAKSGIGESLRIAELARQNNTKLMIGCMTETMVGLSAAMFFALGTGFFDYIDLDSAHFLFGTNAYPGLSVKGPVISIEG
jgi:L-alanine-DL-glutamate epimerase-like enolase superfamily enzyme